MKTKARLLLVLSAFMACGCSGSISSVHPLVVPDDSQLERRLIGTWRLTRTSGNEHAVYFVHVSPAGGSFPRGAMRFLSVNQPKDERPGDYTDMIGFVTSIEGEDYLSLVVPPEFFDHKKGPSGWAAKWEPEAGRPYQILKLTWKDDDDLTASLLKVEAMEPHVEKGDIAGKITAPAAVAISCLCAGLFDDNHDGTWCTRILLSRRGGRLVRICDSSDPATPRWRWNSMSASNEQIWQTRVDSHAGGRVLKHAIDQRGIPLPYSDVLHLWQDDKGFRSFWIAQLCAVPFEAYRWETPAITTQTMDRPFEFVVLDSPDLATRADPKAFASHFQPAGKESVVIFRNLGNDADLVVPCPAGPTAAYAHLGAFIRTAPESQKHALWQVVGQAMQDRIDTSPLWLSTAGAGVAWLHVRIDSRPKYYGYSPYRQVPGS